MAEPAGEILTIEELAEYFKIPKSTLSSWFGKGLSLARRLVRTGGSIKTRSIHGSSNSPARRGRLEGDDISMAELLGFHGTTIIEKTPPAGSPAKYARRSDIVIARRHGRASLAAFITQTPIGQSRVPTH